MKKIIFCGLISILILTNNASSQNTHNDSMLVLKKLAQMKKDLNLSQKQVDTLKPLLMDNYERNEMFRKNLEVVRRVQEQNDQTTEYEMSKILTPDQLKQYLEKKDKNKAKKKELRIREKMAFYRQELKLTDQQYNDLKSVIEQTAKFKEELKMQYKNNDEMFKAEMKKLKSKFEDQIKKILSPEQFKKYKELQNPPKS
jgi:hypothetical protein